tara:strand:- start:1110 stop:1382 length:273 start_codon:yes stop_codon:yes gene_type:complete
LFISSVGKNVLKNVLEAYAFHNTKIGYAQSLNFIAGLILIIVFQDKFSSLYTFNETEYIAQLEELEASDWRHVEEISFWLFQHLMEVPPL